MKINKKTRELYRLNPDEKLVKIDDRTFIVIKPGQNEKERVKLYNETHKDASNYSAKSNADYQKVKKYNRDHYHKKQALKDNLLIEKKQY